MANAYGKTNSFLLVGVETIFNTPVSTVKDLGIISDWNSDGSNNIIEVPPTVGEQELSSIEGGQFEGTANLNGTLNSGAIFELMFGQCTDTETTGDYKHTFIDDDGSEVLTTTPYSFTLSENHNSTADLLDTFGGCNVNKIDISMELNSQVKVSSEVLFAGHDTGTTAGTKVTTTTKSLIYTQTTLSLGVEGSEATVNNVQNFKLSIDRGMIRVPSGFGARTSSDHLPGTIRYTGEFTKVFRDKTELELFLGGTSEMSTVFTKDGLIYNATNGTALGSGRLEFYVKLYGVVLTTKNKVIPEEGPVEITLGFQGTTLKDLFFVDAVATYF